MRLEGYGLGNLTRIGVQRDAVKFGDLVTIAVRETNVSSRYLMQNILLPSGEELVMTGGPRWSGEYQGLSNMPDNLPVDSANVSNRDVEAEGIVRVWSWGGRDFPWFPNNEFPLTNAARIAQASFNLDSNYPLMQCVPPGMPRAIAGNAWPIEFVQNGDDIEIRMEEFDLVRRINMAPAAFEAEQVGTNVAPTPLGYSVGRWESDRRLVVRTAKIHWPYHDGYGVPQSEQVETAEIFTLSDDESRLLYEITVTDPVNFTEPVVGTITWQWIPGQEIRPYECQPYE